jgi:hypothetical protein
MNESIDVARLGRQMLADIMEQYLYNQVLVLVQVQVLVLVQVQVQVTSRGSESSRVEFSPIEVQLIIKESQSNIFFVEIFRERMMTKPPTERSADRD